MTSLRSKKDMEMARALYEINELRKDFAKREKEIRDYFKGKLGSNGAAKAGEYLIITSEKSRRDLDRKALAEVIDLEKFQVEKSYCTLEIKKAS